MKNVTCDVAIIGAGTAGLAAERSARRQGATTLLIDEAFSGTTCSNVGCMPSKLLIAAGNAAHAVQQAALFGINAVPDIDGFAVLERLRRERDKFVAGVIASIEALPKDIKITGHARFAGPSRLSIDGGGISIDAKAIVIATGAAPQIPDFLQDLGNRVLTNETLFDLPKLPASIAVIGAGAVGLELGQALGRLGVETTLFSKGETLAGLADPKISECLKTAFNNDLDIHMGVDLKAELSGNGVIIHWTGNVTGKAKFEYVIAATGRPPRLKGLDLNQAGLVLDERGVPKIDPTTMQCGNAPIFMAGDADPDRGVLHEAQWEGTIAGANAAKYPNVMAVKRMTALSIIFTDPQIAVVGERPTKGDALSVYGESSYANQGRARVCGTNQGIVQIFADRSDGRLTGAVLAVPAAEHMAHLLAWAIQGGLTASDVLNMPFYHPTYEEGLKPALREICKTVGRPVPMERDDELLPGA